MLREACEAGLFEEVCRFVADGVVLDEDDGQGTAVIGAARSGKVDCLQRLVDARADLGKSHGGNTPAHLASLWGHSGCLRVLCAARADLSSANCDGDTPVHVATQWARADCLQCLCDAGADVNRANNAGDTPLTLAVRDSRVRCLRILCGAGATVGGADGDSVAMMAARRGNAGCLRVLFEAGVDVEAAETCAREAGFANCLQVLQDCRVRTTVLTAHFSPPGPDGVVDVSCTAMNGEEVAAVRAALAEPVGHLVSAVKQELSGQVVRLLFPDGRVLAAGDFPRQLSDFVA